MATVTVTYGRRAQEASKPRNGRSCWYGTERAPAFPVDHTKADMSTSNLNLCLCREHSL